jgi:biopolymer transport protein TolR
MAFSAVSSSTSVFPEILPEINVTPLIDVLLVLLIIFMVIVPVRPRGLSSQVPQGAAVAALRETPVSVRMIAGPSGAIAYEVEGRRVAQAQVGAALISSLNARDDRALFVEASPQVSYRVVAELVGRAKAVGATAIALGRLGPQD